MFFLPVNKENIPHLFFYWVILVFQKLRSIWILSYIPTDQHCIYRSRDKEADKKGLKQQIRATLGIWLQADPRSLRLWLQQWVPRHRRPLSMYWLHWDMRHSTPYSKLRVIQTHKQVFASLHISIPYSWKSPRKWKSWFIVIILTCLPIRNADNWTRKSIKTALKKCVSGTMVLVILNKETVVSFVYFSELLKFLKHVKSPGKAH